MKKIRLSYLRWTVLMVLLSFVLFASISSEFGEWYAIFIYPTVSKILSAISSLFSFSLDEWVIVLLIVSLLVRPFYLRMKKKKGWFSLLTGEVELLLWIYVWFYWAWGMNYDRFSFYRRADVKPAVYDEVRFHEFLASYTNGLNEAFSECCREGWMNSPDLFRAMVNLDGQDHALMSMVHEDIKSRYRKVPSFYGLCLPQSYQFPKRSSFNAIYSNVGVLGFMGPFFSESHVNLELSVLEYPFTYAHELSHLLGVSSEAEANLWAYVVCIQSSRSLVRLSGYMGILSYVRFNAKQLLRPSEFEQWESSLPPEVMAAFYHIHAYWTSRYNSTLGDIQSAMYTFYLKRNKISSGQKNYAQVIGMLLSLPNFQISLK